MKRILTSLLILTLISRISFSQSDVTTSKPIVEIHTDFHVNLSNDANKTGFNLNRAFLGYEWSIDKNFYATIILNAASPEDLAPGSKPRRYAFLREATMNYNNDKLTITMGMIKTKIFMYQQTFWGMRYLAKPFQDVNGYGGDSDLGIGIEYRFNEKLEADASIINGEGGGSIQLDNNVKATAALSFKPTDHIYLRFYEDFMKSANVLQYTSIVFAGYKAERGFIGGEFNFKTNMDSNAGHHSWGISATGGITVIPKVMVFGRYDLASSVTPSGYTSNWNEQKDGNFCIAGVQYSVSKNVRLALDYQANIPYLTTKPISNMLYLNLLMKI